MPGPNDDYAAKAHPAEWLRVADNLLEQAVKLHRMRTGLVTRTLPIRAQKQWTATNRSVFLLAGFALENAIKAFLILENPDWIANGRLANPLRNHKLTKLLALATSVPHKRRSEVITRAFEAGLESWARYPCGLHSGDIEDEGILTEDLWSSYLKLMAAYGRRLQKLLSRPWNGPHDTAGSHMEYRGKTHLDYL